MGDPDTKSLQFQYTAGPAGLLRVTASDGTVHDLRVGLIVFNVSETGEKNEEGAPQFEIRASVQFDRMPK